MEIKPILFSTPMVKAIMDGRKSMTRRIIPEKIVDEYYEYDDYCNAVMPRDCGFSCERTYEKEFYLQHAKYQPGDILWVRESWCKLWSLDDGCQIIDGTEAFYYAADGYNPTPFNAFPDEDGFIGLRDCPKWRPSIFMPKEACRLFLRVTDVRAERLQDVNCDDAMDEGISIEGDCYESDYVDKFKELWDSLNAKRGYGWSVDPWVWVYSFERCEKPEGWC
jgi:hypothetical protein